MKATTSLVSSLLATAALARPRSASNDDLLKAKSRITAFVINEKGEPSVECWEISSVAESMKMQRNDGSQATSHALSLSKNHDLEGVDILTWPSLASIWPPAEDSVHSENFDLHNTFNLFNIQGGLINFNFYAARFGMTTNDDDDDVETHIFSLENGDDWFYFEDDTSSSLAQKSSSKDAPFAFGTMGARRRRFSV